MPLILIGMVVEEGDRAFELSTNLPSLGSELDYLFQKEDSIVDTNVVNLSKDTWIDRP